MARNESWQPTSKRNAGLSPSVTIPAVAIVFAGRVARSKIAARQNVIVIAAERVTDGENPTSAA